MPFYVVKTASKVYIVTTAGAATELTMPAGITVQSGRPLRSAVLDRHVVSVNGASQPLWIDPTGTVPIARALPIPPPPFPPVLAASSGAGALSGTFNCKVAFLVKDRNGEVIAHGPYSDISNDQAITSKKLAVSKIAISTHPAVNCRRVARTTTGPGDTYFEWFDIDDNTTTALEDDVADEALSLLPISDELGTAPSDLELIVEWKRRLWGKSRNDVDSIYFTADGLFYAWPASGRIRIPPFGNDLVGVSGFIRRRDELAVGRLDRMWKIIGDDPTNFARLVLVEGTGIVAPDSVVVNEDIGYWLAADGVYTWGPDGVKNVSAPRVHGWFATDDYFNRANYRNAVGWWDKRYGTYNLLLSAAGSSNLDRWVSFQAKQGRWFGPHKTDAFTPTFAATFLDSNSNELPVLCGSNGHVYKQNQAGSNDDTTAIDFDVILRHNCKTPDIDKVFLQMSLLSKIESGGTLTITPALGGLNAADQSAISANLTLGRQRLRHISTEAQAVGRILKLRFRNQQAAQPVHLHGYEIPFHESGRR